MKRVVLLTLLLAGCRSPQVEDPDLDEAGRLVGDAFVEGPGGSAEAAHDPAAWWERFEDPALDALVTEALQQSLDLRLATAVADEARARAEAVHGLRLPSVDVGFAAARRRDPGPGGDPLRTTALVPAATVAWQADLFGRLRSTERAALARVLASEEDRLALEQSLIAEVVRGRVALSVLARRLALTAEIEASRGRTLEIVEDRYSRGLSSASAVSVHLARENLAAARAATPALERELGRVRLGLDVLVGRKPGSVAAPEALVAPLPPGASPPAGVPAALLDRRPDLRAARARVEAGLAEVDASLAALRPDLVLGAEAGWSADELSDLFEADSFFAGILANLTAPVFAGGRLRAEVEASRARLETDLVRYAARSLQAVREVEDALLSERLLAAELTERVRQRDEARAAEELARQRYGRGLEELLTVLDTERRRASAEDRVLLLENDLWNARVDLFLALGGDWLPPSR